MIEAIESAIWNHLNGDAVLTAALSSADAIYADLGPNNAVLPYVIFQHMSGGDENVTQLDSFDVRYMVKVISTSGAEAASIAGLLRDRLHNSEAVMAVTGWGLMRVEHQTIISFTEFEENVKYWHRGGVYRIQASLGT